MNGLKYIMQLEGATTVDVAKKMKVNRSLISVWQTGRRFIPDDRVSELAGIFPQYPAYYFNKELSEEDMIAIRDIKIGKKKAPIKDERLERVENIIQEQLSEYSKVLSDAAAIMQIGDITTLLKNSNSISDKQILTLFLSVVSSSQQSYLHDYKILNQLEQLKKDAKESDKEDYKLSVIGVTMSALAVAFGLDDDLSALAVPNSIRGILPLEAVEKDFNIKRFSEWREKITAVLKDIIDYCDEAQLRIDKLNEELRRSKMIIEFLRDVIENSGVPGNYMRHEYSTTREHSDSDCEIDTMGSELWDKVAELLISDKAQCVSRFIIDANKFEIKTICYINNEDDMIEEDVAQTVYKYIQDNQLDEYHQLCRGIVESSFVCVE